MPSADTSNLAALLKIRYPNGIAWQGVKQSRFWALCKKTTNFGGTSREVAITVSPGTGGSSSFDKALVNRGPAQHLKFTVTRRKDYVIGSLENEVIKATMGNENAILSALTDELDKKGREFGIRLSRRVMGNAGGSLGVIATAGISGSTITLATTADSRNFYPGLVVVHATDDGTGTSPSAQLTGSNVVTKVNHSTGVITFNTAITTAVPAAAANDYLFTDGDYGTAPNGVFGWIPTTDPTTTYLGVDRTVHIQATSGTRVDKSGKDLIEALNESAAAGVPYGVEPEYGFVSGDTMARFQNTLEGKAMTRDVSGTGKASYKGLVVFTTYGEITLLTEPWMPNNKILLTSMSDWEIASLGELPHFTDTGHGKTQQESMADALQYRLAGYWNLINTNPAGSILVSV